MALVKRSEPVASPSARDLRPDRARLTRSRLASSEEFRARRLIVEPFTLLLRPRRFGIALREEFVQRIPRPALRLDDEPAAFNRDAHLRPRTQSQDVQ